MPDGDGYVVLSGIGHRVQVRIGCRSRAKLGTLGVPVLAGSNDQSSLDRHHARRQGATWCSSPTATVSKGGPRRTGRSRRSPSRGRRRRRAQHRGDARRRGLLVLDRLGGVWKYGSATTGYVGDAETPMWYFSDVRARHRDRSWMRRRLRLLRARRQGAGVERRHRARGRRTQGVVGADRFRSITYRFGKPYVLRNDGVAFTTS